MKSQQVKFIVGDTIRIGQRIQEGKKERVAYFKGKVVKIKGSGENTMFTVRQVLEGIEVDRIYPMHLPTIEKIEILEKPKKKIKRANLAGIHTK